MTVSPAYVVASTIGRVMPHHSFRQVLCKPSFRSCYFQKEGDVTVPLGALLAAEAWHQLLPCGQHGRHVFVDSCRNKSLNSHACTISVTFQCNHIPGGDRLCSSKRVKFCTNVS